MPRWDLAAMAAGAAWLASVVAAATESDTDTQPIQNFLLAAAGVATAVVYIERNRHRIVAEVTRVVEAERRYSHLKLIDLGRAMGSGDVDGQVVPLRARTS